MIKAVTIYNKIERLRRAIRREGTPAIQETWDEIEPYVSTFMNGFPHSGASGKDEKDL